MSNLCSCCLTINPDDKLKCLSCGAELSLIAESNSEFVAPNHLPPGTFLKDHQYQLEKTLGQGGFAITYQAKDLVNSSRYVAIKELWPDRAGREDLKVKWPYSIPPLERQEQINKFQDEAQNLQGLAKFKHPSIVKIYDWFEENSTVYIVMEFIDGKTLHNILKEEGILSENRIKKYFLQLAYALKIIHENNLLHRDIKPDNIIINHQDRAVLIDFGASREFLAGRSKNMTRIWTPGYAPPEQYSYRATRHPSADIYSLCAAMYELLTGRLPADALDRVNSKTTTLGGNDSLIPLRQVVGSLSPLIERIILTGMNLKVEERFQDANYLIEALNGNYISPLLTQARELVRQGNLLQAAQVYQHCLLEEPENSKAAVEKALVLIHLNDSQAEAAVQQALQLLPDDGRLHGLLGLLYCRQSNWSEAVKQLQRAVNLARNESWIWANLGWALVKCGQWKQSVVAVNKALELDEHSTFALGLKAWMAVNQKQWQFAIPAARQAISSSQQINSQHAQSLQAWIYPCLLVALHNETKTTTSELEICLQEYMTQVPDNNFAHGFKGWLQASQGQWANALVEFEQGASKPKVPFWIILNLGIAYEHVRNSQAAIKVYQDCHQVNSKDAFVLFRLGTTLGQEAQRLGQRELWLKACLFLELASQVNPDYAEAYHNLGWVLHHIRNEHGLIDNYPKVLGVYRQAIQLYEQQNQPILAQGIKQAFDLIGLKL
ncbi:MAG: protein kinase [Desmonostoc vinosum HA7617-LM4]|jgi:serine/threonine protein kinase|nr:protein kinase [Desmonostoc vinosum HA7617-LM4]